MRKLLQHLETVQVQKNNTTYIETLKRWGIRAKLWQIISRCFIEHTEKVFANKQTLKHFLVYTRKVVHLYISRWEGLVNHHHLLYHYHFRLLWFNFILGLKRISFCLKLITMLYRTLPHPRTKENKICNISTTWFARFSSISWWVSDLVFTWMQ